MSSIFKKIDSELDRNPNAVLMYYTIVFGVVYSFCKLDSIPLLLAICLYEIKRR